MTARKTVGIKDVAREAGVSATTVSHVLNNVTYARVNEDTRARVQETAARLGYRPNRTARALRTRRSEMIGLLSEDIATTPHAGAIIRGAQEVAQEAGLTLVLINTTQDRRDIERDVEVLRRQDVDGVLYATMYHRRVSVPERLLPGQVPTVLINAEDVDGAVPGIVPDEVGGARAAVEHLLDHGHRRIGFLTNVDDVPATSGRLEGYRASLASAGVEVDETLVVARPSETYGGFEAAMEVLRRPDRPSALFCYNDRMAMGAYRAASELGLRVPQDLSVVGFDNQAFIAEGLFPSLTTVALPHYEMGRWATRELIALTGDSDGVEPRSPQARPEIAPCPLIVRESVAPPRSA